MGNFSTILETAYILRRIPLLGVGLVDWLILI